MKLDKQELEYRVLQLLEQQPTLSQRALSRKLGFSLGKTHYAVKALVDAGWLKLENYYKSDNKIKYLYILTPKGSVEKASMTKRFLIKKIEEYERLEKEIEQLRRQVGNV